jgi:hypothetical protein
VAKCHHCCFGSLCLCLSYDNYIISWHLHPPQDFVTSSALWKPGILGVMEKRRRLLNLEGTATWNVPLKCGPKEATPNQLGNKDRSRIWKEMLTLLADKPSASLHLKDSCKAISITGFYSATTWCSTVAAHRSTGLQRVSASRAGGMHQVVEYLPSKCKALNWNSSTTKKETECSWLGMVMVAYTCNLSYVGGRDWENRGSRSL